MVRIPPVAVPGVVVKFDLVDKSTRGGYLSNDGLVGEIVSDTNRSLMPTPSIARTLYVRN